MTLLEVEIVTSNWDMKSSQLESPGNSVFPNQQGSVVTSGDMLIPGFSAKNRVTRPSSTYFSGSYKRW